MQIKKSGEEELVKLSTTVGTIATDSEYEQVQKIFDVTKRRERTSIPQIFDIYGEQKDKFRGRMLSPDDVCNLFAGDYTDCCQRFNDLGEGSVVLGSVEENAGIFVIEKYNETNHEYQIVGQSLTLRQKGKTGNKDRLCFDNIEIAKSTINSMTEADKKDILQIYKDAAEQAIKKDSRFLKRLLKQGKISEQQYNDIVLKEVIVGTGYNDLKGIEELMPAEIVTPEEGFRDYLCVNKSTQKPWLDSVGHTTPMSSKGIPKIIKTIDEVFDKWKVIPEKQKITKLSDIPLWYKKVGKVQIASGTQINAEVIDTIKEIEKETFREEQQLLNNNEVQDSMDLANTYDIDEPEDINIAIGSTKDWYLVYSEDDNEIYIAELAMRNGINSPQKVENKKTSTMLATAEATDTVYEKLLQAAEKGKKVKTNLTKDSSLINVKKMVEKGLIEIKDSNTNRKIIYNKEKGLIYEDDNTEIEYRKFSAKSDIEMLDICIIPDKEKLKVEKQRIEEVLLKVKDIETIKGAEKEIGLDELRDKIRKINGERSE